jgi:two-component system chemotaxis response regulator CheB
MVSTLTARGAASTLDALAAGASDYVTKPANVGSVSMAMARIREELIPKIKALCAGVVGPATIAASIPPSLPTVIARPLASKGHGLIERVVIGVSTGGPNALSEVIPALPGDLPVPILVVQHMPPVFTRLLAERLDQKSALRVTEAVEGELVEPSTVYLAPGDFHMTLSSGIDKRRIRLNQGPPENSCRPAVDVLFRSAAAHGSGTLAVILTGMGQDGLRGCEAVRDAGGRVLAQDEATSVVWGMPGFIARAGLAEQLVPLPQVAQQITRLVMERRSTL